MSTARIQAIIFDCDGTLVDSETLGTEVLVRFVSEFGLSLDNAGDRFRGRKMADCVDEIERELGRSLPDSFVPELRRRIAEEFERRLQPIEGADLMLRSLTLPFCVASSGPREKIELSLAVTGLLGYFEGRIFSSYDVGFWKPDPGLFLHAARSFGVLPERCAVVEDSLPGIEAGRAAGMQVFAFRPSPLIAPEMLKGTQVLARLGDLTLHL